MNNLHTSEKQKEEKVNQTKKRRKIPKFYLLVSGIIIIQIFIFLVSPRSHPLEDYVGVLLAGIFIIAIGGVVHLIVKLAKSFLKKINKLSNSMFRCGND